MANDNLLSTCAICGKKYSGWGNSTWGLWAGLSENDPQGEKVRCCDSCNARYVVPARMGLIEKWDISST